jgi:hypothetical protein
MDRADVIRKAQKLMSYTDANASPAEVANAADKLGALLRDHNLSMTDVKPATIRSDVLEKVFQTSLLGSTMPAWYLRLGASIAGGVGCLFVVHNDCASQARFIGPSVEVEVAVYFINSLLPRLADMAIAWPFDLRESYLIGIADTIELRLKQMYSPALQESSERGLMCLKKAATDDYMQDAYPNIPTNPTPAPRPDIAYMNGRHDGISILLSQGIAGSDDSPARIGDPS